MRHLTTKTSSRQAYGTMFLSFFEAGQRLAVAVVNTCDFDVLPAPYGGYWMSELDSSVMIEKLSGVIVFGDNIQNAEAVVLDVTLPKPVKFNQEFMKFAEDFIRQMVEAYLPVPDGPNKLKNKPSQEEEGFLLVQVATDLNPAALAVHAFFKDEKLFAVVVRYKDNIDPGYYQNKPLKIGDVSYVNGELSFVVGKPWEDFEAAVYFKWCEDLHFGKVPKL